MRKKPRLPVAHARLMLTRKAGRVARIHTMPLHHRQTVGEHTYGVLMILHAIRPNSMPDDEFGRLLLGAMYHDTPEAIIGDVPSSAKWAYPSIEEGLRHAEDLITDEYDLPVPSTAASKKLLRFADLMELAMFCVDEMASGNSHIETVAFNALSAISTGGLEDITPEAYELFRTTRVRYESMRREHP